MVSTSTTDAADTPTLTHPSGRQRFLPFILIGLVLLIGIGLFFLFRYLSTFEETDDAQVDGHLTTVASRIDGSVIKVYTENNQRVKAGKLLLELDPRDYQVAVQQAEANLLQAKAGVGSEAPNVPITQTSNRTMIATTGLDIAVAQAALQAAHRDYEASRAQLKQAQANSDKAAMDVRRYRPLVDKDEVSQEQFDQVVATAKVQAATVEANRASMASARALIAQREEALHQAEQRFQQTRLNAPRQVALFQSNIQSRVAAVKVQQAALAQAQLNLSYCKIYAPLTGIVGKKTVEVGSRVQPGGSLMAITPTDDIWITANFKETQLRRMRSGQRVTIHVDAFDRDYDGYVESLPGASGATYSLLPPENATGNYVKVVQRLPVRIRLKKGEDPYQRLRPGMSVEPKVWLDAS